MDIRSVKPGMRVRWTPANIPDLSKELREFVKEIFPGHLDGEVIRAGYVRRPVDKPTWVEVRMDVVGSEHEWCEHSGKKLNLRAFQLTRPDEVTKISNPPVDLPVLVEQSPDPHTL